MPGFANVLDDAVLAYLHLMAKHKVCGEDKACE